MQRHACFLRRSIRLTVASALFGTVIVAQSALAEEAISDQLIVSGSGASNEANMAPEPLISFDATTSLPATDAQPFREFLVAANVPVVVSPVTEATIDNAARSKRCQEFFRLPFGPIEQCRTAIVGSAMGAVLATGAFQWWKRGFNSQITRINEGGFGRETYTGGVDKLSHAYTFYIGTRLVSDALQWGGYSKTESVVTSAVANAATAYLIELFDGYSKKTYGFSREDLVADAVGIVMGSAVAAFPDIDRKFAYRMRYVPKGAGGSANFIDSYEGQTYFLTARLSGFADMSPKNPLRYLELVFGYRGTGFKPREGIPGVDYARHERRTYYGIGLNVEEILRGTIFKDNAKPTRVQAITEGVLTYVQLPGTVFAKTHAF